MKLKGMQKRKALAELFKALKEEGDTTNDPTQVCSSVILFIACHARAFLQKSCQQE